MIEKASELITTDPAMRDSYEKWKQQEMSGVKEFFRLGSDGKYSSPYEEVQDFITSQYKSKDYNSEHLTGNLRTAEKFWIYLNRKRPRDWTANEAYKWLSEQSQGSRFQKAIGIRAVCKTLRDIPNFTKGLKVQARIPSVMKLKEFPEIFESFKRKCLELTPYESRAEMEFILKVKPATGIRTGNRLDSRGLFGTKIGAPYKSRRGYNGSHIQVVGDSLIWHVLEKMYEEWDINFFFGGLDSYIKNYVRQRSNGKYLIETLEEDDVNSIFGQACEALGIEHLVMHDMRKVYVTALVRSGVPLEKAIKLNVGWKDIGTAYKHYLILSDLGEKEQEFKNNLASFFKMEGAAITA